MAQKDNSPRDPRESRELRDNLPEPKESREPKEPKEARDAAAETAAAEKPVYRYPGSGQATRQQKMFKLDDIIKWDMNFGVMIGPVGYDPRMRCPYCEGKMQLSSHEGGTAVKGIRILYQCSECGAQSVVQFYPPGRKVVLPDEDYGDITVVMREVTPAKEQPAREARERSQRPNRPESKEREDRERPEKQAKQERGERSERERQPRGDRSERPDRPERTERNQPTERGEQPRRLEKGERPERRERREAGSGGRREPTAERREGQNERREERRPRRDEQGQEVAVIPNREGSSGQPRHRRYPSRPRPARVEGKMESKAESNQ